jgi:hypothetical protein
LLFANDAHVWWSSKAYEQATVLQKGGAWPVDDYVGSEMEQSIDDKRGLGQNYDPPCRPLWLLLSIADIRAVPREIAQTTQGIVANLAGIAPFDRIVVTASGMDAQIRAPGDRL